MMSALKSFDRLGIFCWKERSTIQRAFNRQATALENMGVDHGGLDILVPEEFLDGVVGVVQQGDATRCLVRRASLTWSMSFFPWVGDVSWGGAIGRAGFVCDFIVFSPLVMLKSGVLTHVILTYHRLKS